MLVYLYYRASADWDSDLRVVYFVLLVSWMFTSKFIKLMGHYIRYPGDFLLLPVSISFGYFHSLIIKVYAMLSLNIVSSLMPGHTVTSILRSWTTVARSARQMVTGFALHTHIC